MKEVSFTKKLMKLCVDENHTEVYSANEEG